VNFWEELRQEFADLPDTGHTARIVLRLLVAVVLGGLLGWERQRDRKPAGLRTHMLVCLGSALFVLVPQFAGMDQAGLSRVIQGLLAGIGFLGGASILKLSEEKTVQGVTTAAGIWVAAAVGVAAGLGRLWCAFLGAAIAYLILSVLGRLEYRLPSLPAPCRNDQAAKDAEHKEPPVTV
jgi:putative Mg2+ transporter-C (MgtC) family protein